MAINTHMKKTPIFADIHGGWEGCLHIKGIAEGVPKLMASWCQLHIAHVPLSQQWNLFTHRNLAAGPRRVLTGHVTPSDDLALCQAWRRRYSMRADPISAMVRPYRLVPAAADYTRRRRL